MTLTTKQKNIAKDNPLPNGEALREYAAQVTREFIEAGGTITQVPQGRRKIQTNEDQ